MVKGGNTPNDAPASSQLCKSQARHSRVGGKPQDGARRTVILALRQYPQGGVTTGQNNPTIISLSLDGMRTKVRVKTMQSIVQIPLTVIPA